MRTFVDEHEYERAALWYTEQFNQMPYDQREISSVDERIIRIRVYDEMIDSLEKQIAKIKRQQDLLKLAMVIDWKQYNK